MAGERKHSWQCSNSITGFLLFKKEISQRMESDMNFTVINRGDLPFDGNTYEFEGIHRDTEVSFIWVDMPPGGSVRLHKHPYKEIFIIQEGVSTFTVGTETLEARAGQIVVVPANVPHKFRNAGDQPLRQVDIHMNKEYITIWLE
jgi:mannose-6-phosphate isomerase-like protein (cupin superfamily)